MGVLGGLVLGSIVFFWLFEPSAGKGKERLGLLLIILAFLALAAIQAAPATVIMGIPTK